MPLILQGGGAIGKAVAAARAFGTAQGLTDSEMARLCIVVEEVIANLYDHGGVTDQDRIQLTLASDPKGIRVAIVDPGKPFDPWSRPPLTDGMAGGGGAGLSLIRAWAELIGYHSSRDGNYLDVLLPVRHED